MPIQPGDRVRVTSECERERLHGCRGRVRSLIAPTDGSDDVGCLVGIDGLPAVVCIIPVRVVERVD